MQIIKTQNIISWIGARSRKKYDKEFQEEGCLKDEEFDQIIQNSEECDKGDQEMKTGDRMWENKRAMEKRERKRDWEECVRDRNTEKKERGIDIERERERERERKKERDG